MRPGRVARAGRTGVSYSLVSPDEIPFLIDLHLFLGRPLSFADPSKPNSSMLNAVYFRVTTCPENLEMSGNLTAVREMSRILIKVRKVSGEKILSGKSS